MVIELVCQECGRAFVPTREDLLRGPAHYRVCPPCRALAIEISKRMEQQHHEIRAAHCGNPGRTATEGRSQEDGATMIAPLTERH